MPTTNLGTAIATKNIVFEYTGPDYKNVFGVEEKSGSLFKYNAPELHSTPRN
jgi:hypothetical protein